MEEKIKSDAKPAEVSEDKQEKSAKEKPDKLTVLKAKQEKAAAAVEKAAKKAKAIQEEIAAEERKQHDKDVKILDGICKGMKTDLAEIILLMKKISDNGLSLKDISEMIGGEKNG